MGEECSCIMLCICACMQQMTVLCTGEDLEDEEIQMHVDCADFDGDGEINFDEFAHVINVHNALK